MPIKSVKMKISKNKKMRFFLMSQGSLDPKIRFIGQKVCSVARVHTDRQTDTKVNTEDTLSGFQEFFLQPIIKDRSKNQVNRQRNSKPKSTGWRQHDRKRLQFYTTGPLIGRTIETNTVACTAGG